QTPYAIMSANAAGYCYLKQGRAQYLDYAKIAFSDFIRYFGVTGGYDQYVDPNERTPTCYNSNVYVDTESKVHGWANRYGMYLLAALTYSCPECTGDPVILQNVRFKAGTDCRCQAATSITLGPNVIIEKGARVAFEAPKIEIKPELTIQSGAVVDMRQE
ncbi:MAG: family serine peptidase, partial [Thermodesulfobacteriota bacterium]|nr:family serine peptidase [Thermodesulfobacteriota bacterium]